MRVENARVRTDGDLANAGCVLQLTRVTRSDTLPRLFS